MDSSIERKRQLEDLNLFIETSYGKVNNILEALCWDKDYLCQKQLTNKMSTCPIDGRHRMPNQRLHEHMKECKWKNEGYSDSDMTLPEIAEHTKSSLIVDKDLQFSILNNVSMAAEDSARLDVRNVPQTSERMLSDFTPSERLALYDYAVANTMPAAVLKAEELNVSYKKGEESRTKTKLELLMEMRDAKRRRISYRSKKVHTNRKSHVEILREVIQNQMEFLQEINSKENGEEGNYSKSAADLCESDMTEHKRNSSSVKSEANFSIRSSESIRAESYDSHEYYTKHKNVSRKQYSEGKYNDVKRGSKAGTVRYENYEQSFRDTNFDECSYYSFADRNNSRREISTDRYYKRKREGGRNSDHEGSDTMRSKKRDSSYSRKEHSKYHMKHRSSPHGSDESSFSRSEIRTKDGMKKVHKQMSCLRSEFGETSGWEPGKQKHNDKKHKYYKLGVNVMSKKSVRSDSESREGSYGKQTADTSEDEHASGHYYAFWKDKEKHDHVEKLESMSRRKHHKRKKRPKYYDGNSSEAKDN